MTDGKRTSGKRVVLVMVALLAVWCVVLAYLVWRGTKTPRYQQLRPPEAGEEAR
jgi:hypothetical protein